MNRLDFTEEAVKDLREIGRYTKAEWGIEQARRYRQELELSLEKLALNPQIGRPREEIAHGVRSFKVASHIAFYATQRDGITVVRLLHPSMDIERVFERDRSEGHER